MDINASFPLDPNIIYLNHAAVAPWPEPTRLAVSQFAQENTRQGAANYPKWLTIESQLRQRLAQLIGADSTRNIALQKSTSEGLSTIAYGIRWQKGDKIVISNQEFPSNRIVWESLAKFGVQVIEADVNNDHPEQSIIDQLTDDVRLLAVSSVQYGTGLTLDLERLGEACRSQGCLFCIDAIQSLGAIPFDVGRNQADFVVADGHKWMLGPEGTALLYLSDRVLDQLELHQFGWHMVQHRGNYDLKEWSPAKDATRYECGSPNMMGVFALNASLGLLLEIGIDTVYKKLLAKIQHMEAALNQHPQLEIVTDTTRARRSGILTFKHKSLATEILFDRLKQYQVVCASRGGGIRFSPHFYTADHQLELAVDLIPK